MEKIPTDKLDRVSGSPSGQRLNGNFAMVVRGDEQRAGVDHPPIDVDFETVLADSPGRILADNFAAVFAEFYVELAVGVV